MLTVTPAAGARLARMLDQRRLPDGFALRLVYEGHGIAVEQDEGRPGDTTFEHEGRTVLRVDAQIAELLADDTLDMDGTRLALRQPKKNA